MHDVFLSYSREDRDEARELREDLQREGLSVWWDQMILPGQDWKFEIRQVMRQCSAVVLCFSKGAEARKLPGIYSEALDTINIYREFKPGEIFIIPVRFSAAEIPPIEIDGTRTLDRLQYVDLFPAKNRAMGVKLLIASLRLALQVSNRSGNLSIEETARSQEENQEQIRSSQQGVYYIRHIQLRNIRGFRKLDLHFAKTGDSPRLRTLIIGKNGTGKTTLLRCIAVGLCAEEDGNALLAEDIGRLVRDEQDKGEILIRLNQEDSWQSQVVHTVIERKRDKDVISEQGRSTFLTKQPFLCAYGIGRNTEGTVETRPYRIMDSARTLFRYDANLAIPELIIRRLQDYLGTSFYEQCMTGIEHALGLSPEDHIELPQGGGVVLTGPSVGTRVPLQGWADGHHKTFSWILDLFGWAIRAEVIRPDGNVGGILLIDEIEQHLHPSLLTDILQRLSRLFPNMQIIATTHSPLAALSAGPGALVVLRRKEGGVEAESDLPDVSNYSAEDMIADERLFDTEPYGPETSEKLREYRHLADKPQSRRSVEEQERLNTLVLELKSAQLPALFESPLATELKKFREKYNL